MTGPAPRGEGAAWLALGAALAVGLGVFLVRERMVAGTSGFPLDDAWIHLQFARNLADGHGFSYNPGVPVAGSTAPLWTLLLAGAFGVTGAHPLVAKALGIALALAAALVTRRLVVAWTGQAPLGLLAGLVTALSGPLLWGALSGMEVVLAALLVAGALLCHTAGHEVRAALLTGLAALARPEAVILLLLLWLASFPLSRRAWGALGLGLAPLVPWVAFNLATGGTPLPATARAKIEGGLVGWASGAPEPLMRMAVIRPAAFLGEWTAWLWSVNPLLPLLVLPGLVLLWTESRRLAIPALILVLHPLAMALLAPYRGPAFQEGRYSIHLLPVAIAVAMIPLAALRRAGSASLARRLAPLLASLVVAGAMVALWPAAERYAWAVQNIEAMQVRLGHWVARHVPGEAVLALNDIGAIGYVSRREVVDLMGLVTPAIIPYRRQGEAGVLAYLERACPDYLIIFPAWFPGLAERSRDFAPRHRVRLERNTVAGADEMVVYETAWSRWRPDPRPCPAAGRSRAPTG
ncbi:MAG: hypothetical protein L0027_01710 [Candidatus Rokubacteria bacterium]|nr:hypothetical protein [Candidatus Rokubacteria bacterium]